MSPDLRRAAYARYERRRREAAKAGEPYTTTPDRAQAHIRMLLDTGFTHADIHRAAGVGPRTTHTILASEGHIYRATEEAILACTQATVAEHARRVPTTVPTRMVRALTRLGWGPGEISRFTGITHTTIRTIRDNPRPRIQRETAELIGEAYDAMTAMPTPSGDYANRVRRYARRRGWEAPTSDGWRAAA